MGFSKNGQRTSELFLRFGFCVFGEAAGEGGAEGAVEGVFGGAREDDVSGTVASPATCDGDEKFGVAFNEGGLLFRAEH